MQSACHYLKNFAVDALGNIVNARSDHLEHDRHVACLSQLDWFSVRLSCHVLMYFMSALMMRSLDCVFTLHRFFVRVGVVGFPHSRRVVRVIC